MQLVLNFSSFCLCICFLTAAVIPTHNKDPLSDQKHNEQGEHNEKYDQDAFLGQEEAEKFRDLTPEESKAKLEKLLTKIDSNADGEFDESELKAHIRFMQRRYILNDVDRTWSQQHATGASDGALTWKEYREVVYGPETTELEPDYKKMLERDQRRWKAADKNSDESLDKAEYTCFVHPEDCDHMKDIVVTETIADIDKNGDGVVDVEEYIGDMYRPDENEKAKGEEPDWVKSERDMFKQFRDKNDDGKLDKEEMREWIMPTDFDHAEAEARHLIYMADDNKDQKLSKEEILTHYDVFVGSQATDYGEQLRKHDPSEL